MCISPLRRGALSANLHGLSSKSEIKCHTINRSLITMFKTSTYLCSMLAPHASNYCASCPQIYIIHYSLLLYQTREYTWFLASSQWLAQSFEIHCEVLFALSVQLSIVDCLFKWLMCSTLITGSLIYWISTRLLNGLECRFYFKRPSTDANYLIMAPSIIMLKK